MSRGKDRLTIRPGGRSDVPVLLALFAGANPWLVSRGQTGQWGSDQYSSRRPALSRCAGSPEAEASGL